MLSIFLVKKLFFEHKNKKIKIFKWQNPHIKNEYHILKLVISRIIQHFLTIWRKKKCIIKSVINGNGDIMNFRYRLMQFMSGRYGADKLSNALLILAAVVSFVNLFVRTSILQLIVYALIIYAFFRMLSRNIEGRRRENQWFNEKLSFLKKRKEFYEQKKADTFHVYKKCPACKAILRLPHRIGEHTTVCPRCGKEFKVKVRK